MYANIGDTIRPYVPISWKVPGDSKRRNEVVAELQGPALNLASHQSELAPLKYYWIKLSTFWMIGITLKE